MSPSLLQAVTSHYNLGSITSHELIKEGVSNLNYKVKTSENAYIVRVCKFEPKNQLHVMVPFLRFAAKQKFSAPHLILTKNDESHFWYELYPVIVTTLVGGYSITLGSMTELQVSSLVDTLHELHQLDWEPEEKSQTLRPEFILNIYEDIAETPLPIQYSQESLLRASLAEDFTFFNSDEFLVNFNRLPQHVVHGDLIPGNVLFENRKVSAIIDLEEVGKNTRLLDIARFLSTWLFINGSFNIKMWHLFISEYNKKAALTPEEKKLLPTIVKYITFRHAVFVYRMATNGRTTTLDDNGDVDAYFYFRDTQNIDLIFKNLQ